MKRVFLVLLVLIYPLMALAQESTEPSAIQLPNRLLARTYQAGNTAATSAAGGFRTFALLPPTPQAPSDTRRQRPRPEGSMVGYIDNAIVGSHIRLRFDGGFHAEFPDRAEFFYAKCGCYQFQGLVGHPAYDPNAPGPQPGVATDLNFQQLHVNAEYAPNDRFSVFAEVPFRWLQPKAFVPDTGRFENQSGIGDIAFGFKAAVAANANRYVTLQFRIDAPTGDASQGLGVDHVSIEPSIIYYERITPRLAIESQFAFWHPIGGSPGVVSASNSNPEDFAGNVLFYGIGPSYELYSSDRIRFGPVVELAGWRVLDGFQTVWISAARIADELPGTNVVNLKAGFRTAIGPRNSIYVGYGRALTDAVWYKDIVRAEFRHSF